MKLLSEPLMGLGLLKYIRNGWDRFAYFTCIEVRNGSNVLFWKDHGLVMEVIDLPILSYSDLLQLVMLVSDYVEWVNGTLQWKPLFNREAQYWELKSLDHFFSDLYAVNITLLGSDRMVWLPSPTKGFQVSNFYRYLLLTTRRSTTFPWNGIWKVGVPPKVDFFHMDCYTS